MRPLGCGTAPVFGFDLGSAGGISAGAAGGGPKAPGAAGNVTNIAADAIASIVAGHLGAANAPTGMGGNMPATQTPTVFTGDALLKANLATKVDGIILNGFNAPSLADPFTVTFNGQTSVSLLSNSSPVQVANAIDAITTGVSVAVEPNGYQITFLNNGPQPSALTAQEPAPQFTTEVVPGSTEVQNVQVFGIDPFSLTYQGVTTNPLPANATADMVRSALNGLSSLQSAGITVSVTTLTGVNYPSYQNTTYQITFNNTSTPDLIVPISLLR